jgi:hypothetical protein
LEEELLAQNNAAVAAAARQQAAAAMATSPMPAAPTAAGASSSGAWYGKGAAPAAVSSPEVIPKRMADLVNIEHFERFVTGYWLDSLGNSILVNESAESGMLTARLSPHWELDANPTIRKTVAAQRHGVQAVETIVTIERTPQGGWKCGGARLESVVERIHRLVWITKDGRRSIWGRAPHNRGSEEVDVSSNGAAAFPWRLSSPGSSSLPEDSIKTPRDILYDAARIAAIMDVRQMIGATNEGQEALTRALMDLDLHGPNGDYLVPSPSSQVWLNLGVPPSVAQDIVARIHRIPSEATSHRVGWSEDKKEILIGKHKILAHPTDIKALEARWVLSPTHEHRSLEIARLLALYSIFDNPLSNRRSGLHLGLDPNMRRACDYELFASPLNAAVPNGRFASKWPHIEYLFGSIGCYPSVMEVIPTGAIVCINPPFTEAYLNNVMERLAVFKLKFRCRIAVPIWDTPWRKRLQGAMPGAQLVQTYYNASEQQEQDLLHPTLLWEDPRCPKWKACLQERVQTLMPKPS